MRRIDEDRVFRRSGHRNRRLMAKVKALPVNWNALLYFAFCAVVSVLLMQLMGCGLAANGSEDSGQQSTQNNAGTSENAIAAMAVGDTQTLNFSNGVANLTFDSGAQDAHYVLALSGGLSGASLSIAADDGATTTPSQSTGFRLATVSGPQGNPGMRNHQWFRSEEQRMAGMALTSDAPRGGRYLASVATQSYKVLTGSSGAFVTITANQIAATSAINLYQDITAATPISQAQRDQFAATLTQITTQMTGLFGQPSDIDGNGKIDVVLTPTLSNYGGSPLSGYFWSGDLMPVAQVPGSNHREVLFLIAPDTNGFYGGSVPVDQVLSRVLPGVYAHEFQHLLNFIHKTSAEDPTVNEALSHTVENWIGYPHELRYKEADCLLHLQSANLGVGSIDIPERGCAELVIQHLCEQQGNVGSCLAGIITSPNTGWANVAQATGQDVGNAVAEMLAALVVTGSNLDSTSALRFTALSTGPGGDVVGFDPYSAYDDHRGTTMDGAPIDSAGIALPYAKNLTGFGTLVEIIGQPKIKIQVSGSSSESSALFSGGGSGVLIRIADTGSGSLHASAH